MGRGADKRPALPRGIDRHRVSPYLLFQERGELWTARSTFSSDGYERVTKKRDAIVATARGGRIGKVIFKFQHSGTSIGNRITLGSII